MIVVATGPLTNVAEALRLRPSIARKIRLVEVMGGAVWTEGNVGREWPAIDDQVAEWNIWVDPVAAQEVLASGVPVRFMPLDVTDKVVFYPADAATWRATGTAEGRLAALRPDLAPNCQSCRRPRVERIKARLVELLAN